jgi:hypothetical protein
MKNTLIFLLLLPIILSAQPATNLLTDKEVFEEKKIEYSKWLKSTGLGKALRVQTVHFVKPEILSLDLVFYTENTDSVIAIWQHLKQDFAKLDRGITLEQELFYKMVYFMDIKPEQGFVQVYDTYNPNKTVCFRRSMAFLQNTFIVDSAGCKTQIQEFVVEAKDLSNLRAVPKGDFAKRFTKQAVLSKIQTYIQNRFTKQVCDFRKPAVEWIETNEELWFTVKDLCKEVLTDETNPFWCSVLTPLCETCKNCTKRELLDMHIKYSETATGFRIHVIIDAKFGSGWYNEVKRGAYKNMELDYKRYVEQYAVRFKNDLFNELKKLP